VVKLASLVAAVALAGALALAVPALADDRSVMQRLMGHDAYAAMVEQMRGVLGDERANEMLAQCEAAMAAHDGERTHDGGRAHGPAHEMSGTMRMHGTYRMHGGR
jgi:hypothetical protein